MQCDEKKDKSEAATIIVTLVLFLMVIFFESPALAVGAEKASYFDNFHPIEITGFLEERAGVRTTNDPEQKNISVLDSRLQLEIYTYTDWVELKYKGAVWGDGVTEKGEYETREIWFFLRPYEFLDVKIGRQVLTWGTGDLVFINDLFPKDWQSYFIGRDKEYLKAPSDAAKMSFFTNLGNIDLVYTPQFDADRYITGEYISYWSEAEQRIVGQNDKVFVDKPDDWFQDEEIALRLYKNISNYEIAFYGYFGFWKQPSSQTESGRATFSKLNVYGASIRGLPAPLGVKIHNPADFFVTFLGC
ncbi:MAG: hypothetical protein COA36_13265 [Desulfotalea sp.]|nr:MAG: hypothetical protein COA36_13265 [Desulfotalea sp.]